MSSNANSRNSPSGGNGSGSNTSDRPRLTDAEKKQNHILSEQKRRLAIRHGFDRLAAITPGMSGQGRSEAMVLDAAVDEIKKQTDIKNRIKRKVMKENPDVTSDWFERFYIEGLIPSVGLGAPVAAPAAAPAANTASSPAPSNTSSTGSSSSKGKSKSKRVKKEN
jgi:heteromeric Ino2p/Ino4p transcription factor